MDGYNDLTENKLVGDKAEEKKVPEATLSSGVSIRSVALTGIFLLLLFHTLRVAAPILIPITMAGIFSLLLSPIVRRMKRWGLPEGFGASLVLCMFLLICASGIYGLSEPAQEWMKRSPEIIKEIEYKLRPLSESLEVAKQATEDVSEITESGSKSAKVSEVKVKIQQDSWISDFLTGTPKALANIGIVVVLLFFLLAGGDSFLAKLVAAMPKLNDKKRIVTIVRDIQSDISSYLLTITTINTCLGFAVSVALMLLGMPNPALWGVMVGLLNFAPYIGPALSTVILLLVAFLSFDTTSEALLIPAVVLGINVLEGQLITPQIVGKRLSISPVVVFISIVVWGWLWGIAGALMAIPIVVAFNVICQRVLFLNPVADFIGGSIKK